MPEYRGKLNQLQNVKIGIVVARFNEMITKSLLEGALDTLKSLGIEEQNVTIAWVPGSFEIPLIAKRLAQSNHYDGIICLGAVIRGATAHFDYVAGPTASGIANISLETGIPITFGILTTDTIEQAIERAGTKAGNKGSSVTYAVLEMIDLLRQLSLSSQRNMLSTKSSLASVSVN